MKIINYRSKNRISRISFCEWNSESFGRFNTGGIICESCNFSRSIKYGEKHTNYELNNKIERIANCPKCGENNWYYLPPIARVPRKNASKAIWKEFWFNLKNRVFNHPKDGCR